MATPQTIWGIDVGRCALKALKLRVASDSKVEIVTHDYIEHAKILTQPDADRHELIAAALEKFLSHNDLSKDLVVVSVPGQHTLSRFTKLPPVAPKRIPDIVRYEADQQIPFDMDDVIWDYQTFADEDSPDLEVGIFAMKRELLREHLLHFEQAAVEPIAVQSCPLALYNAANFDGLLCPETTVLLDVGAANTDLVIATTHGLWTRTIPIGGNSFTEALVKAFKLSFTKAEALKRGAQTSKYRRQIFQAMRPIFADLVQELQRSMGYYSSTHREAQIEKVVGTGNSFQLPDFQKYVQQNLGMEVERVGSFQGVAPSAAAKDESLTSQICSFTVAYGLALQGLELAKITSNLLPTEIAKQVVWRKKRSAFAAAAACLVLAGGLIWFRHSADMRALAASSVGSAEVRVTEEQATDILRDGPSSSLSDRAKAVTIHKAAQALRSKLNKQMEGGQGEREETEDLIALQNNKTLIPNILHLIHESLPASDDATARATTNEEFVNALSDAPPRGERQQVFLTSVALQFEESLNDFIWDPVGEVEPRINDDTSDLPGIKIEIECTTPNEGGPKFVREAFMDRLRENGRRPNTGFYIDRVWLIDGTKVDIPGAAGGARGRGGASRSGYGATGGRGGTYGSSSEPSGVVAGDVNPQSLDVLTNESIEGDWRFVIWADVILEDYPEPEEDSESETEEGED
ncbi:MAG: type IV pilus assembly protein PilM [Planctomycetota bacterium]|jgi:type IV pilus assembly protein PilM